MELKAKQKCYDKIHDLKKDSQAYVTFISICIRLTMNNHSPNLYTNTHAVKIINFDILIFYKPGYITKIRTSL